MGIEPDEFMVEAMREVDALTPSVPPIAPPPLPRTMEGQPVGVLASVGGDYRSDDCYVLADGSVLQGAWVMMNYRRALELAAIAQHRAAVARAEAIRGD